MIRQVGNKPPGQSNFCGKERNKLFKNGFYPAWPEMLQHLSSDTELGRLWAEQGENIQPLLWPPPAGGPAQLMHHVQSSGPPVPSLTPERTESLLPVRNDTAQEGLEISQDTIFCYMLLSLYYRVKVFQSLSKLSSIYFREIFHILSLQIQVVTIM